VLEKGGAGRAYNIDGNAELTNLELTEIMLERCGASWDMVEPVADRKGHDRRYSLDDSLLRHMGYAPRIPFKDGLKDTVCWYQANRQWWAPLKPPSLAVQGDFRSPPVLTSRG
jgi:dTDP-glucose 4,6-dehydratase